MRSPAFDNFNAWVESDERKPIVVSLGGSYGTFGTGGWSAGGELEVKLKPAPALEIEVGPIWERGFTDAQYVRSVTDPAATATYGGRYVFGELNQTEVSMATRVNLILSPRMSLQLYAQPLLSSGHYQTFKEAAQPRTYQFTRYGIDAGSILFDAERNLYAVDPTSDGSGRPFVFDNPDFNFKSLRINTVYRWEFRPGSTMYVVWTQQRQDEERPGRPEFGPDMRALWRAPSDNVLMVKVSYWLSR